MGIYFLQFHVYLMLEITIITTGMTLLFIENNVLEINVVISFEIDLFNNIKEKILKEKKIRL